MGDDRGDLRVRPAVLADRPPLALLWAEIDALHARIVPGFFGPSAAARGEAALTSAGLRRILASGSSTLLVAERLGDGFNKPNQREPALAGCIRVDLYDTPDHPGMRPRRRAHVERIVVAHGERRRGVGRLLMTEAAAWARRRGASQIILTVWAGNDEADAFYRALGYRTVSQVLGNDL